MDHANDTSRRRNQKLLISFQPLSKVISSKTFPFCMFDFASLRPKILLFFFSFCFLFLALLLGFFFKMAAQSKGLQIFELTDTGVLIDSPRIRGRSAPALFKWSATNKKTRRGGKEFTAGLNVAEVCFQPEKAPERIFIPKSLLHLIFVFRNFFFFFNVIIFN